MNGLIDELKQDHILISNALQKAREKGITMAEGRRILLDARSLLLEHLAKEDRKLYPALRAAAENDEGLRQTLEAFASDMDAISNEAMQFFEKYGAGDTGMQFARDVGSLIAKLSQRIRKEETIIYEHYRNLQ